ncbi:MAG: hypothetical protein K5686_09865 [Lachnospiraceae bacterium]|nr:hypothetical protein [Lachnospiraceae bacterium]
MVNRVDNRSSVAAAYESTARKRKRSETDAPAFLLGDEEGVVWERGDKKEKAKPRKEERIEERVEESATPKKESVKEAGKGFDIHEIIGRIRDRIRAVFDRALKLLWYGEEEKKEAGQEEKEMSKEEKEEMKLLHNTSILTCYDKEGKLTKMEGIPGKKTYRQHI